LKRPATPASERVLTSVRWFNEANRGMNGEDASLVSLAIGFEALLGLPPLEKTDRLVDAIGLLLGRGRRLEDWAQQFYKARSDVVHEGHSRQMRFVVTERKGTLDGQTYQSLLTLGRVIFRSCLGTVLVGSDLAEQAGIEEKLVANHERFESMCKVLKDDSVSPLRRLASILEPVCAVERYRFVHDGGLRPEAMIGTVRLAARALLACAPPLPDETLRTLQAMVETQGGQDLLPQLEGLRALNEAFPPDLSAPGLDQAVIVRTLVNVVWQHTFMEYYRLKKT